MKQVLFLIMSNLLVFGFAQPKLVNANKEVELPFKAGEWFKFRIHYGFFNASYATLGTYKKTHSMVHPFCMPKAMELLRGCYAGFKVEDHYDTYFDEKKIILTGLSAIFMRADIPKI